MTQGHNPNVQVNVYLDAAQAARRGFGLLLLIAPESTDDLDGERVVSYASLADAQAAQDAGHISAGTLDILTSLFGQPDPPDAVLVGNRDDTTPESWSATFSAIRAIRDDWYAVCSTVHTDVATVAISDIVEAITPARRLFVAQSSDTSWLDSGTPSGVSTILDNERTVITWHNDGDAGLDVSYAGNRLAFEPDERSVPWHAAPIPGVPAYATALTDSQRSAAIANNCNVLAAWGSYSSVIDPGITITGRPISELVSADWFEARVREAISDLVVKNSQRGRKVTMDARGQGLIQAAIEGLLQVGVAVEHFAVGQTVCTALAISDADRDANRLRFEVRAQLAGAARQVTVNVYLGRSPVVSE